MAGTSNLRRSVFGSSHAISNFNRGVKKPLNPILGEWFTCHWDFEVAPGTQAFYISEQTSHHPPKSSYFYMSPQHHIRIDGTLKPQSRFLGNSAASMMNTSIVILRLLNRGATVGEQGGGEKYILTQPNMYVRGILFGKMKYELGDHSYVRCTELDLVADIEFKVKGFFTGAYNAIGGHIKRESTGENLYEISGSWNGEMYIKDLTVSNLWHIQRWRLTWNRLENANSSLTQLTHPQHRHPSDRSRSKTNESHKNCGIP